MSCYEFEILSKGLDLLEFSQVAKKYVVFGFVVVFYSITQQNNFLGPVVPGKVG